ncbi:hypothetical protein INR49_020088, partial [Caranx melampygus]
PNAGVDRSELQEIRLRVNAVSEDQLQNCRKIKEQAEENRIHIMQQQPAAASAVSVQGKCTEAG